jgi:replicative DNA helicase
LSASNGYHANGHVNGHGHVNGNGHATAPRFEFPDRLPPQNIEAEQGVIGSVLQEWAVMGDVADVLTPDDFYRDAHQSIWRELLWFAAGGLPCDGLILADRLTAKGLIGSVGGREGLVAIQMGVPHAANARHYAEIVKQKSTARALVEMHNEGLRHAYANQRTAEQLTEEAERAVFAIGDRRANGDTVDAAHLMAEVMETAERRRRGELVGLSSGLSDLDDATCGFQPENLIYVAGRTSMGKTALALNVIEHNCVGLRKPVLLVSLEMNRVEIGERLAVSRAGIDGHKYRAGFASDQEMRRFSAAAEQIAEAPLFVDGSCGRNAAQIAANARRHRAKEGIELLVIDLINHVEGDDPSQSRREQMTLISRRFKGIGRELKIPVMVLAQLNRGPENREGNRPRKSDLKECGGLEEDADLVLLLHRPEYYDPNDSPGTATIIVDKNRNGPTRDIRTVFRKDVMRFECLSPAAPPIDCPAF